MKLEEAQFFAREGEPLAERPNLEPSFLELCKTSPSSVTCSNESGAFHFEALPPVLPYDDIEMRLKVKDEGAEPGALNELSTEGGGALGVTIKRPVQISSSPAGFGIEEFALIPEEEGGEVDAHAGSHPYQLTNALSFNRDSLETLKPPALPRNLEFKLPPGEVGNAAVLPQCSDQDFAHVTKGGRTNLCPGNTVIGVTVVTASTFPGQEAPFTVPIFNLTPATGEPARFGFEVLSNPVILDTALRSGPGEDYGVTVSTKNITQVVNFIAATTVFWGAPNAPSHNESRGWGCLLEHAYQSDSGQECELSHDSHPSAFLTLPTNCEEPYDPSLEGSSWPTKAAPDGFSFPALTYELKDQAGNPLSLTGCNQLAFAPSISAQPTAQSASSPSGLAFNLNFDDEGLTSATGSAESQLKDTSVVLPEGLTIDPSAGVGLGSCSVAQFDAETAESPPGAGCPENAKLGTVEIETPLLAPGTKVEGSVYIATPYQNPFSEPGHPNGSLVALYIVAKNARYGILVRLAGKVDRNPTTGQLTTTFQANPQLPFSHFRFHFREGQQAPLITPQSCGTYATQALLSPWSEPLSNLTESSSFQIDQGVGGGPCPAGQPPFSPQITSGMVNNAAGAFSPFVLHLSRGDADQEISGFSTSLPPGLTGDLTGVPFCPEENIAAARHKTGAEEESSPSCPAASQVGHTLVGTGVGAVLAYVPGQVYLAGPYNGTGACATGTPGCAPFSIVSVTSAKVGPFDLGTVVLRFGLNIDPYTAQVSVSPSTSEPIPTIIDGIVTHVRDIRVSIERPGNAPFTLNPTSCNKLEIGSTLTSDLGASSTVASPFQTASCQSLKFEPKVAIATSGKTSKADGASLTYTVSYPNVPIGTDANIKYVKVELPKQLPSRLTTLQKACTAPVFAANPASCPAASIIGHAKAVVPNIPVPLEGPVYFVSNGGEAFPNLVMVLQGYGVTIDLVGDTLIKNGVTSTTFKTVPDNPLSSFEINLPEGPYSALAANGNLCKPTVTKAVKKKVKVKVHGKTETMTRKLKEQVSTTLTMPNEYIAQNGATYNYNAKLTVTDCGKAKPAKKKAKAPKRKAKRNGGRK